MKDAITMKNKDIKIIVAGKCVGEYDMRPDDIPSATTADAGKVLTIGSDGKPAWKKPSTIRDTNM